MERAVTGAKLAGNPLAAHVGRVSDHEVPGPVRFGAEQRVRLTHRRHVLGSHPVRRRAERDKIEISKYAVAGFAREILPVADNLRRALDSIDQKTRQENETVETLVVGVEMTERDMLNAFERIRITPIEALGQKFDHNLHEAMFEIEDKDQPEGTVVQVLQTGYMLGERLLRPARVGVSKGGPTAAPEAEPAAEAPAEPAPKGPAAAYEKQAERHGDAAGSKVDEEL